MPTARRKHVPLRTCIACHQKQPKQGLIRVVRRPEGPIEVDPRGKLTGRGAYICCTYRCWEMALERGKLGRALKCKIGPEQVEALKAQMLPLLKPEEGSSDPDS
jgi:predicted RNA-binding protein YlxR (DUF448 family)